MRVIFTPYSNASMPFHSSTRIFFSTIEKKHLDSCYITTIQIRQFKIHLQFIYILPSCNYSSKFYWKNNTILMVKQSLNIYKILCKSCNTSNDTIVIKSKLKTF